MTTRPCLFCTPASAPHPWVDVNPRSVDAALGRVRIIDVRQPDEFFGELGHLPEAELVPLGNLGAAMRAWDRREPLLIVCRSGRRSGVACDALVDAGFESVHNLAGGMLAWHEDAQCRRTA